ncbi:type II secretory pathway protein [Pseudoalteromonas sp. 2CM41L]|uniref:secretin N-terminal domain-containing protein n=1 Tax=unclassified Pseudoalteromonas TaxID=194690 RepID=UPI0020BF96E6|nr:MULTISPECIES: secretin N-terminal domain-containing protein [unclassified Pseudoalteromonas]MCK8107716.1 type II secretory pathway protein [Pseudoalteromonas sp. 2CM41L]MCK8117534.1 type II secretory pathway protein [Pseudoalteromonas sp. 2CM37A]MCK8132670.1 type II secretory pathway protein [Pseudoalteromonas sp. 2CM28B]
MSNRLFKTTIILPLMLGLTSCALLEPKSHVQAERVTVNASYLDEPQAKVQAEEVNKAENKHEGNNVEYLTRLSGTKQGLTLELDLSDSIKSNKTFQVSVNALPLNDFIHYIFGELLDVSYLLEASVKANATPVTLDLKQEIPAKELFLLAQQILSQNNINIVKNDRIFFLHTNNANTKTDKAFGFGRTEDSVPNVSGEIVQLVPILYDMKAGLRSIINQLVDAKTNYDASQGLLTIVGLREQVIRSLSLIGLLDSPFMYNKSSALLSFEYINSETFTEKVSEILAQEGISVSKGGLRSTNVKFVPLEHLGKVVVFASSDEVIDRVTFWLKQLDKPVAGAEQSFYIYNPRYARASDLGESLAPLLGGSTSSSPRVSSTNSETSSASTVNSNRGEANSVQTIEGDNVRLVVDSRANALIFYSTGQHFQELQPIIRQLDIMPKQVMMEVVIAEVKLTGAFSKGVQFAIESGKASSRTESFSFDGEEGFNYSIVGLPGNISVNLSQTDGLVNVLSRPTLLVRDGVAANISVGDDIPTVGSTTTDPISGDRQTTEVTYRKTGVDLTVTPTINAQGTVIMSISQNISNVSTDGSGVAGNPSIFERTLSTEVVAGNGQTVMLGGLISENKSNGASSVPFFGDLPLFGHLFRSDTSSSDKTELVILVTPKIVQNSEDWERVKGSFLKGLENISF